LGWPGLPFNLDDAVELPLAGRLVSFELEAASV
jgi:hypothetical protein